ncbi:response regulator transcription factor [Ancylobacter lacus]|nr:response regulator transcription factor [Ancylobacter lacus]
MALSVFQAGSAVFYWIDDDRSMVVADTTGPCCRYIGRYLHDMQAFDPLNIDRLVSSGKRVATMSHDRSLAPRSAFERYSRYLSDSEIADVLDFVFWQDDEPIAGLGILKHRSDPLICGETLRVAQSMQPYIEYQLGRHPRPRDRRRQRELQRVYGLTGREIEIAELIRDGLANRDIAETLNIGLGTVKTHLLHIFQKMEVSNRTMLSARLAGEPGWTGPADRN